MKLYFDKGTRRELSVLFRKVPDSVTRISAAVAYTHDATLVDLCASRGIELDWWGLFSSEGSTDFQVIEKAISSPNIRFYPFAEFFHPKVIWFHGFGLYVGSHNMTKSALERNVQAEWYSARLDQR